MIKLNLGSGSKIKEGFINLDKYKTFKPDIVHDLEKFPYPFKDSSVDQVLLSHILEHLGSNSSIFNLIIQELYRICKNGSIIDIIVPHPRNDDFISDPTHVRPITDLLLSLYDKELNLRWKEDGAANSPLALIHNVNFKIIKKTLFLEKDYEKKFNAGTITREELDKDIRLYNNVVKENHFKLKVIKS